MSASPEAYAVIEVYPLAERLRFKGRQMRLTLDGGRCIDYRVSRVSMPDEFGRCKLTLSEVRD